MSRCVIIAGADIKDYNWVNEHLKEDDFFVYCDSGLKHLEYIKHEPDLIVGDFDSHERPDTDIETITLPCEKDDTDTFYAIKEMLKRGFNDFVLVGVIGNRFDHSMANISALLMLKNGLKTTTPCSGQLTLNNFLKYKKHGSNYYRVFIFLLYT